MAIAVGEGCNNRGSNFTATYTLINMSLPADGTGTIDAVCIWANTDMSGIEYATFTNEGGNTFSTNGHTSGSALTATAGAPTTHEAPGDFTAFPVTLGDFIGIYYGAGKIEGDTSGYTEVKYDEGDQIPASSNAFNGSLSGYAVSVYATGAEAAGGTILPFMMAYHGG